MLASSNFLNQSVGLIDPPQQFSQGKVVYIHFNDCNGQSVQLSAKKLSASSSFNFKFKSLFYRARYVKCKQADNQVLWFNIRKLTKTFCLKSTDIRRTKKVDSLINLVAQSDRRQKIISPPSQIFLSKQQQSNDTSSVFNDSDPIRWRESLLARSNFLGVTTETIESVADSIEKHTQKRSFKQTKLPEDVLLDAVWKAYKINFSVLKQTDYELVEKGYSFLARVDKGVLNLHFVHRFIGSGAFGEAYEVWSMNIGRLQVYKQACIDQDGEAVRLIMNEYEVLNEINAYGSVIGLQGKPSQFIHLLTSTGQERFGYIGKKYKINYLEDIRCTSLSLEQHLFDMYQLLYGLRYLSSLDIVHGDIKPENIFVRTLVNGMRFVHLADFGGAQLTNKLKTHLLGMGSRTNLYTPKHDLEMAQLMQAKQKRNCYIYYERKRDIFAMGLVFYNAFTKGQFPYPFDSQEFPDLSKPYQDLYQVPWVINDLIKSMVHADLKLRPSAERAFERLDDFIKHNHPQLASKIELALLIKRRQRQALAAP